MDLASCSRILVFGGSFDPPHVGHVMLPLLAMEAIGAERVAYVPAGQPPHKRGRAMTPAQDRLAMLRLALAEAPWATVLTDEIDRAARTGEPSYTVDTLQDLRARLGPAPELRLLIGADMLRSFDTWKEPQRIIALAEPSVMVRPPDTKESLLAALPRGYERAEWAPRLVNLPLLDISATMIRERAAKGLSLSGFVHPQVERYIVQRGLYRGEHHPDRVVPTRPSA